MLSQNGPYPTEICSSTSPTDKQQPDQMHYVLHLSDALNVLPICHGSPHACAPSLPLSLKVQFSALDKGGKKLGENIEGTHSFNDSKAASQHVFRQAKDDWLMGLRLSHGLLPNDADEGASCRRSPNFNRHSLAKPSKPLVAKGRARG